MSHTSVSWSEASMSASCAHVMGRTASRLALQHAVPHALQRRERLHVHHRSGLSTPLSTPRRFPAGNSTDDLSLKDRCGRFIYIALGKTSRIKSAAWILFSSERVGQR